MDWPKTPSTTSSIASLKVGWANMASVELFSSGAQLDGEIVNRNTHVRNLAALGPQANKRNWMM